MAKPSKRAQTNAALREQIAQQEERLERRSRLYLRFLRHWEKWVLGILAVYVGLPILAPTLMAAGATGPGEALYTLYSPFCHQFAFRSVFLYGEQPFYPRDLADFDGKTFEEEASQSDEFISIYTEQRKAELRNDELDEAADAYVFNPDELDQWSSTLQFAAREFRGDEQMGYKIALCQRDVAIYAAMVVGGTAFIFVRRRLRPVPLVLYLMLGILPIGFDGFSQLLGYLEPFQDILPERETTPVFRILTGALFGLMNVWLIFPYLEQSMKENAQIIENNLAGIEEKRKQREKRTEKENR